MTTNAACGFKNINALRVRKSLFLSARVCVDFRKFSCDVGQSEGFCVDENVVKCACLHASLTIERNHVILASFADSMLVARQEMRV